MIEAQQRLFPYHDFYSEEYEIYWKGKLIFVLGFRELSVLANRWWVGMEGVNGIENVTPSGLRRIYKLITEWSADKCCIANVDRDNKTAARFVEFLGYELIHYAPHIKRFIYKRESRW